jgi:hypothetical protein
MTIIQSDLKKKLFEDFFPGIPCAVPPDFFSRGLFWAVFLRIPKQRMSA